MQVSFVIPLYNCLSLTQTMVASLQATLPANLAHEIILVDDGSTDGTRDWLATLRAPFRVVLNERNFGYAISNNRGATLARGRFVALLNNDLVLLPRWLEPMLEAHAQLGARAGIVGNLQLDARTGALDHAGIVMNLKAKPEHARALPSRPARDRLDLAFVPAVTGACLLIERELWQKLGGFDETFINGGEDVDLCFRARAAGRDTVVALRSVVRHHVSSSVGRKRHDEMNSFRLAQRWRREFIAAAVRPWIDTYVCTALSEPRADEHLLTLHALAYAAGVVAKPPAETLARLEASLAHEFDRWNTMFAPDSKSSAPASAPPPPLTAARSQTASVI